MTTHTTSRRTGAIAFAGAGAIALAALAPATEIPRIAPGEALSVALAATTDPRQAFIDDVKTQVTISGAERVNNPIAVPLAEAPAHIAAGLVASAIRTSQGIVLGPQQFAALVSAIGSGNEAAAAAAIKDIIDGPLWAADPALLSVWDAAPKPIGGEGTQTGAVWQFRESWRNTGNTVENNVLDALKLPPSGKATDATSTSSLRTVTLAVPAAQAAAPSDVSDKKDASDQKALSGNRFEPSKKADDTAGASPRQGKSPSSAHRDPGSKTADSSTGDKSTSSKSSDK